MVASLHAPVASLVIAFLSFAAALPTFRSKWPNGMNVIGFTERDAPGSGGTYGASYKWGHDNGFRFKSFVSISRKTMTSIQLVHLRTFGVRLLWIELPFGTWSDLFHRTLLSLAGNTQHVSDAG
jgi:hypothetical protein